MPYLSTFGQKFKKTIVIFEISTFEFAFLENFAKKTKMPTFGPKCLIWVFLGSNFKKLLSYLKSLLLNLPNCKTLQKNKKA